MSKLRRFYEINAVYNITCNAYAGRPLFNDKRALCFLLNMVIGVN